MKRISKLLPAATVPAATAAALVIAALALVLAVAPAIAQEEKKSDTKSETKMHTTPSGLQWADTKEGTGASPKPGQTCVMDYTGWLWVDGAKGKKFDSSVDRGTPFEFPIGQGRVIKGWDEGVSTMKVGGKRTLLIPPQLGYGSRGVGNGLIPPNSTLLFEVELIAVK